MIPHPSHVFFIHINAYFGFDKKKERKKKKNWISSPKCWDSHHEGGATCMCDGSEVVAFFSQVQVQKG